MEYFDVNEVRQQLISHLTSITSASQANRVLARMQIMTEDSFNELRLKHKDEVNQLIHKLCDLLPSPVHKSQSIIRHASDDIQFFLFERFTFAINYLNELGSERATAIAFTSADQMLRYLLIEEFESRIP